jgi:hypothetical protein
MPERDVPRLESVEFAVEVPAASLESRVAVHHESERRERLRRTADARSAADQCADVLHVHGPGRALGEVLAKDVVEPVHGSVGGTARTGFVLGASSVDHLPGCGDDVVRAPRVCGGKVVAQLRTRAAGPEQETDVGA